MDSDKECIENSPLDHTCAEEFENAVMATPSKVIRVDVHNEKQLPQPPHKPDTSNNTRKRNHSLVSNNYCPYDIVEDQNKKMICDVSDSVLEATITDNHQVVKLLQSISNQMNTNYKDLTRRIPYLEEYLEMKLTQKLKSAIDSRIEREITAVNDHVNQQLSGVHTKVDELAQSYAEVIKSSTNSESDIRPRRFIIKNLPVNQDESRDKVSLIHHVHTLVVKDVLHVRQVNQRALYAK